MTTTPTAPAAELAGDLHAAKQALDRTRSASRLLNPDATVFTRFTFRVHTPAEIDALAAEWHTETRWTAGDSQYLVRDGGRIAEVEAVYYRPSIQKRNGAAA